MYRYGTNGEDTKWLAVELSKYVGIPVTLNNDIMDWF